MDVDGYYSYSKVIPVESKTNSYLGLEVFPNPARDVLYLKPSAKLMYLELFETSGKSLGAFIAGPMIALPELKSGLYILRARFENGAQLNKSLSIEKY